jgi:hypothetical protein
MSATTEITGTVIEVQPTQTFGANGFRKSAVIIDTGGDYPDKLQVEFVKDKADEATTGAKAMRIGQSVTISCNIRGREYNGRYYTSLQGWKWAATDADSHQQPDDAGDGYDGEVPYDQPF